MLPTVRIVFIVLCLMNHSDLVKQCNSPSNDDPSPERMPAYMSGSGETQPAYMTGLPAQASPRGPTSPSYLSNLSDCSSSESVPTPSYMPSPQLTSPSRDSPSYLSAFSPTQPDSPQSTPDQYQSFYQSSYTSSIPVASEYIQPAAATPNSTMESGSCENAPLRKKNEPIELGDHQWQFFVTEGTDLVACDRSGKSDPFVVVELVKATMKDGEWKNIKTHGKTKTPTVKANLNPRWNFEAFSLNADDTWASYSGVKLTCLDRDMIGAPQFMGEAFLWFGQEISTPDPDNLEKIMSVTLRSRPKKSDKVSGFLTVRSVYTNVRERSNQSFHSSKGKSRRKSHRLQGAVSKTGLAARNDMVQISATGRREVKIKTSSIQKYISFGELPHFDSSRDMATEAKHYRKYGFDTNTALWLVTCCALAYRKEPVVRAVVCGVYDMVGFTFLDNEVTDTQGFCMHNSEVLVVCFRGTESTRDWMTNLNFVMTEASHFPQRYLKSGVQVHTGFNEALESVWPQVKEFVDKAYDMYPDLKLYLCGHSLGGALANLCFGYFVLTDQPRTVTAVYTIGQPRVGNKKYREQLELNAPKTKFIRITNNQDCVPHLAGGQHCGVHLHFDATGRLSFNPPIWRKAIQKVYSIQDSASHQSAGLIADHSSPVYRRLIENHWVKTQYAAMSSGDRAFELCDRVLFLIDMLQEDVKGVRRYKIQFRALVMNILLLRPIIQTVQDFLAYGVDKSSRTELNDALVKLFEQMKKTKKEVLARHTKRGMQSNIRSGNTQKAFNKKMKRLAFDIQDSAELIHETLLQVKPMPHANRPSYAFFDDCTLECPQYDASHFAQIQLEQLDFDELSKPVTTDKNDLAQSHVIALLEQAEQELEEGRPADTLRLLDHLKSSNVLGRLTAQDEMLAAFLRAKAHAKLKHVNEALDALQSASSYGTLDEAVIDDPAFQSLRNSNEFDSYIQRIWAQEKPPSSPSIDVTAAISKLTKFEIQVLADLFDEADEDGDNFLTSEELLTLITRVGRSVVDILETLGWIEKKTDTNDPEYKKMVDAKSTNFTRMISEIRNTYRNAVDLDQFVGLMAVHFL